MIWELSAEATEGIDPALLTASASDLLDSTRNSISRQYLHPKRLGNQKKTSLLNQYIILFLRLLIRILASNSTFLFFLS